MSQDRLFDLAPSQRTPEVRVFEQFVGEDGYITTPTETLDWEPVPTWDPHGMAEACALLLEHYHSDHEWRLRVWAETYLGPDPRYAGADNGSP